MKDTHYGLSKDLVFHEIKEQTQEWYDFRLNGIGGSEVGSILRLSDYLSSAELYNMKIGNLSPRKFQNQAMFHGTNLEDYIRTIWQYWDGTKEGYMSNYRVGKPLRTVVKPRGYITNPKYPHLFASTDGIIPKGSTSFFTGEIMDKPGGLEVKQISSFVLNKWDGGIPPYYMAQMQQYMLVLELEYFEIVMLKDGKDLIVDYILADKDFQNIIIEKTTEFWNDRVVPGRKAKEISEKALLEGNTKDSEHFQGIMQSLEPDPDDSEAYSLFMRESWKKESISMIGAMVEWSMCRMYSFWHNVEKSAKKQKTYSGNKIRHAMREEQVDKYDFEEEGYFSITGTEEKNRLNNSLKIKWNDTDIVKAVSRIKVNPISNGKKN